MKHFLKIAEGIDVRPLNAQLAAQPDLWDAFRWRKEIHKGPHGQMSDIWVRYNAPENIGPKFNDEHEPVWYPAATTLTALMPIIGYVYQLAEGRRIGGVLITRIPHRMGIGAHRDGGWHVETFDKFYVSLESAPGARFICHDEPAEILEPKVGECWRFDNRKLHSVENESGVDRVTLIICIQTEKYKHARAA